MSPRVPAASLRIALLGLLALALACQPQGGPTGAPEVEGASTPVARINGQAVTVAELDDAIKHQLFMRETSGGDPSQVQEMRLDSIDHFVDERLLEVEAEKRGISTEELLDQETAGAEVSDQEIDAFYEENKARLGDRTLEQMREQLRRGLAGRARAQKRADFVKSLRKDADVEILIEKARIEVEAVGHYKGPEGAPVTIIEFSDYQCPYCKRAEPTVRAVLERFPTEVRYVYRHFPLDSIHPQARGASEAAICAEDQGRFWEYHDLLFEKTPDFAADKLVAYAEEIGLDVDAFRSCMAEERVKERVERDFQAGRNAGVRGTPAFFVNGISISGARPVEEFVRMIEEELADAPNRSTDAS